MIEILDKNTALKHKAGIYYRDIETWYRSDAGNVFDSPMNVSAGNIGKAPAVMSSKRPGGMMCQQNAFALAKNYCEYANNEKVDPHQLQKFIDFFSQPFVPFSKVVDNTIPVPDQFAGVISDFKESLCGLKTMVEDFNHQHYSLISKAIDTDALFQRHGEYLIKEFNFDPVIVKRACTNLISASSEDEESKFEVANISLSDILQLSSEFWSAMTYRITRITFDEPSNMYKKVELSEDEKINLLSKGVRHLPRELIIRFVESFEKLHYEKQLAAVISASKKPNLFTTEDQRAHSARLKETMDKIQEGKIVLRKK